jgi:hypothetical protein
MPPADLRTQLTNALVVTLFVAFVVFALVILVHNMESCPGDSHATIQQGPLTVHCVD